ADPGHPVDLAVEGVILGNVFEAEPVAAWTIGIAWPAGTTGAARSSGTAGITGHGDGERGRGRVVGSVGGGAGDLGVSRREGRPRWRVTHDQRVRIHHVGSCRLEF